MSCPQCGVKEKYCKGDDAPYCTFTCQLLHKQRNERAMADLVKATNKATPGGKPTCIMVGEDSAKMMGLPHGAGTYWSDGRYEPFEMEDCSDDD